MSATSPLQVAASATISEGARLHPGVQVGANVVIETDVEVGPGTILLPGTVLLNGSRVGAGCKLGPYAVVGGEPMDTSFRGEPSHAIIEDGVELREFVSVHRATGEGNATRVGAGSLGMSYAHVSHNGDVGRGCTLTTPAQPGRQLREGY